jgi:hypothetical protein
VVKCQRPQAQLLAIMKAKSMVRLLFLELGVILAISSTQNTPEALSCAPLLMSPSEVANESLTKHQPTTLLSR